MLFNFLKIIQFCAYIFEPASSHLPLRSTASMKKSPWFLLSSSSILPIGSPSRSEGGRRVRWGYWVFPPLLIVLGWWYLSTKGQLLIPRQISLQDFLIPASISCLCCKTLLFLTLSAVVPLYSAYAFEIQNSFVNQHS